MRKLDIKDKKILYELDCNARQPDSIIAKKVGLSKQATGVRIKKLLQEKIISSYYTIIDISKLGYTANKNFIRLQNMDKKTEDELLHYLKNHPDVIWIGSCDGRFDIVVSFWAKDMNYLNNILNDLHKKFGAYISERQLATIIRGDYFIRDYLIDAKPEKQKTSSFNAVSQKIAVDEIDWNILHAISTNARISATELAKITHKSADAVADHLKKLEHNKIIRNYNIVPNETKYPYLHYKILVGIRNFSEERENALRAYCQMTKYIVYMVKSLGPWEFELDVEIESQEKFRTLWMNIRTAFNDIIKDYSVLHMYQVHKYNFCPSIPK